MLHWDMDLAHPEFNPAIQVAVALSDAEEADGTFICVPGSHREVYAWRAAGQPGGKPEPEDILRNPGMSPIRVPLKAGDMVCWSQALIHGNGANTGERLRLATYISMGPRGTVRGNAGGLERSSHVSRLDTIDCWEKSPWLPALARALGCAPATVEAWAKARSANQGNNEALPSTPGDGSLLSPPQRERVNAVLTHVTPTPPRPDAGDGARSGMARDVLRTLDYCRAVCLTIRSVTGLQVPVEKPAPLDALGSRMIGLEP